MSTRITMRKSLIAQGFTLVEITIVCFIIALVFYGISQVFSSGWKGTQQASEEADHVRVAADLFRALEWDLRMVLPRPITSNYGLRAGAILWSPAQDKADQFLFWKYDSGSLQQIRYSFDPAEKVILREELDSTGNVIREHPFGKGMCLGFLVSYVAGERQNFGVRIDLQGKVKKKTGFFRVIPVGFVDLPGSQQWVFHLEGS